MPPKIIARNADRQGGVLPVSGAARAGSTKAPAVRLKLEVRRLPPGLTLAEFEETLGEEWKLGNGKVDWRDYRQGKVRPTGSGKPTEQSRCYFHLINESHVKEFERRFLDVVFHDKAGTFKNPDLKHLQPALGYAPNQRTPLQQAKKRTDNRQGTIDQDPEFIAFLEAETQPINKAAALDSTNFEGLVEKPDVKTTPLIEDLREKKANKAKAAQAKADKAAEKKEKAQASKKTPSKDVETAAEKDGGKGAKNKNDETAKEGGKAQSKNAAKQKQPQQEKTASPAKSKKPPPSPKPQKVDPSAAGAGSGPPSPVPNRGPASQRQRGNADGIKKMLQKDLGIKPKPAAAASDATASSNQTPKSPAPSTQSEQPPATPTNSKSPAPKSTATTSSTSQSETKPLPLKAYLKHANPSQGMTEVLIQAALSQYGELSNVTIDPRKGTAIAVFKQNEGLKKALEAKKVPVANGAVEVLEFRDRSGGQSNRGGYRGGRGGRGGSRGGGSAQGSSAAASPAPAGSS